MRVISIGAIGGTIGRTMSSAVDNVIIRGSMDLH